MVSDNQVKKCIVATDIYCDHIYAIHRLTDDISNNFLGILYSPTEAKYNLKQARKRLDAALAILEETEWPTYEDYDD